MTNKEQNHTLSSARHILKNLSAQDFLNFGLQDVAYVKPVLDEMEMKYVIHAADGTPLSAMNSHNNAIATIRQNDLEPVTVH